MSGAGHSWGRSRRATSSTTCSGGAMATEAELEEAKGLLLRCARACAAYGHDVVIGGRMALLLYRIHPELLPSARLALATREVDLVVPRRLPARGPPLS